MITAEEFHGRSVILEDADALAVTGHPRTRLYLLRPNANTTFDLPIASYLTRGFATICVVNDAAAAETITIRDNSGATLVGRAPGTPTPAIRDPFLINPGELAYCSLITNADAAGTWHVKAAVAGAAPGGLPGFLPYLMGHSQSPEVEGRVDEYRQDTDTWSTSGSLAGNHLEGVTWSLGVLGFIAGGGGSTTSTESFDPPTASPQMAIPAAHQRAFGSQSTSENRGYLTVFSVSGAAWYEYTPPVDTEAYNNVATFPRGVNSVAQDDFPMGFQTAGRVFIAGGADGTGVRTTEVNEYLPSTTTFASPAPMGTPRATSAAFGYLDMGTDYALVAAGYTTSDTLVQSVERYNPATDSWSNMANFPDSRAQLAGVTAAGRSFAGLGTTTTVNAETDGWWEYLVASDSWMARASFSPTAAANIAGRASNSGTPIVP